LILKDKQLAGKFKRKKDLQWLKAPCFENYYIEKRGEKMEMRGLKSSRPAPFA